MVQCCGLFAHAVLFYVHEARSDCFACMDDDLLTSMAMQTAVETIIQFFSKASVPFFGADKLFSQVHAQGQKGNNIHAEVKALLLIMRSRDTTFYRSIIISYNLLAEAQSAYVLFVYAYYVSPCACTFQIRALKISTIYSNRLCFTSTHFIDMYAIDTLSGLLQQRALYTKPLWLLLQLDTDALPLATSERKPVSKRVYSNGLSAIATT